MGTDPELAFGAASGSGAQASKLLRGTLLAVSTLTVMSGAVIAPALPAMEAYFAEVAHAALLTRLVLTLPGLAIALSAPVAGWVPDRWGRKRLLVAAIVLYGCAGGGGYVLDTLPALLVSRVLLGLGVAALTTAVTTLIADYFEGDVRAAFLGLQASFMALGGGVFLSVAGVLAAFDWRLPFLVYLAAFGLLPFVLVAVYEPERIGLGAVFGLTGVSLVACALIAGIGALRRAARRFFAVRRVG